MCVLETGIFVDAKPLINLKDLVYQEQKHGDDFEADVAKIANHIGAKKLGYQMVILPPGKRAWPYHAHLVNEEMFFILEGSGLLRYKGELTRIVTGDIISIPAGEENAHEIINNSDQDIKYLAVSTMEEPEVCFYPDSHKFGVIAGAAPGRPDGNQLEFFGRMDDCVDYWDGEDLFEKVDEKMK